MLENDVTGMCAVSPDELAFERMRKFHLQRIDAVVAGEIPLDERAGGILVLHLVPECHASSRSVMDGEALKEYGPQIRALGDRGGNGRFNVDGFVNRDGYDTVRAYSQLFRNTSLESVMSDIGYPANPQLDKSPYALRSESTERAVFEVVHDYLKVCKSLSIEPPVWLFSALIECNGFQMMTDRRFRDLSGKSVDRSPAILPELKINDFDADPQDLLRPWCDSFWQASGLERSFNYDEHGKWRNPR